MAKIHHGLMEAYKGLFEDDFDPDIETPMTKETFHVWIEEKIRKDTPRQRLENYLNWNGILGWTDTIWFLSQGGFEV